jgi:hypothetical protein
VAQKLSGQSEIGAEMNAPICGTILAEQSEIVVKMDKECSHLWHNFQDNLKQQRKWIIYVHICGTILSGQSEKIAHLGHNIVMNMHITCMEMDQDYVLLWHSTGTV